MHHRAGELRGERSCLKYNVLRQELGLIVPNRARTPRQEVGGEAEQAACIINIPSSAIIIQILLCVI